MRDDSGTVKGNFERLEIQRMVFSVKKIKFSVVSQWSSLPELIFLGSPTQATLKLIPSTLQHYHISKAEFNLRVSDTWHYDKHDPESETPNWSFYRPNWFACARSGGKYGALLYLVHVRHTAFFFQGTHKSGKFSAVMLHNFFPVERSFDNLKLKLFIEAEFPGKSLLGLMKHQSWWFREQKTKPREIILATSSNLLKSAASNQVSPLFKTSPFQIIHYRKLSSLSRKLNKHFGKFHSGRPLI